MSNGDIICMEGVRKTYGSGEIEVDFSFDKGRQRHSAIQPAWLPTVPLSATPWHRPALPKPPIFIS